MGLSFCDPVTDHGLLRLSSIFPPLTAGPEGFTMSKNKTKKKTL